MGSKGDPEPCLGRTSINSIDGKFKRISIGSDDGRRPSLSTDVALKLFSGELDQVDLFEGVPLELGEDLTGYAVDENFPEIREMEDASEDAETPSGRSPLAPLSRQLSRASVVHDNPEQLARLSSVKIEKNVAESWVAASEYMKSSWQFQKTGRAAAAAVLSSFDTENISQGGPQGIRDYAMAQIHKLNIDDTLYVYDLGKVVRMYNAWKSAMPRVQPFYAVKCNPEPAMLKLLMAMGAGFDCASKTELGLALDLGMPTSRIIFAHPCKRHSDITFAADNHVEYTTFDTDSELDKIAQHNPRFRCVLRIRADDPDARVPLGLKYGANLEDVPRLLQHAKKLGLQVVGVSFHVGSGAKNLSTYGGAITSAKHIFDVSELMGFNMELLDIGGGFTGHFDEHGHVMFGEIARTINEAIDREFPEGSGVRIIAEPGRYFAETSATMFTPVYGQRDRPGEADQIGSIHKDYWITDGLYGSFNCILYDGQNPEYQVVRSPLLPELEESQVKSYKSTVWGPTCDSADCVYKDVMLPQLRNGDWLMFPNAGAYTVAGACDFNGINMTKPRTFYVYSDSPVDLDMLDEPISA